MTADFRFLCAAALLLSILFGAVSATNKPVAGKVDIDIALERERLGELRAVIDRAEDTAEDARAMLPPPPPVFPPDPLILIAHPDTSAHPDLTAMKATAYLAAPLTDDDCPQTECVPQTEPEPWADPCPGLTGESRAHCWIEHAFPEPEWETAKRVMRREGGHHFHPWIENYDQFRRETGQRWTPERARYVPVDERQGWKVYGLFQHRWKYWPERARGTARFHGWGDVNLDPFDGWHNTVVSAWLAGTQGWWHWDVCAESAPSATPKFRCGPGRWL